jgi:hypothetical protein
METEKEHVFDKPKNVKRLLRAIYAICAGLFVLDFFIERHVIHPWEGFPGFYALYGFIGCAALVLIAREMRKVLMRKEDHYDD